MLTAAAIASPAQLQRYRPSQRESYRDRDPYPTSPGLRLEQLLLPTTVYCLVYGLIQRYGRAISFAASDLVRAAL